MSYPPGRYDCWYDTGANVNACPPTLSDILLPLIALITFTLVAWFILILLVKYYKRKKPVGFVGGRFEVKGFELEEIK